MDRQKNWLKFVISGKVSDNLSGVEKVLFLKGDSVPPEEVQSFNKLTPYPYSPKSTHLWP